MMLIWKGLGNITKRGKCWMRGTEFHFRHASYSAFSQVILGRFWQNIHCVSNKNGNYQEANKWCKKSAEQGNADAQRTLAFIYCTGRGTLKDLNECSYWAQKADENGGATWNSSVNRNQVRDSANIMGSLIPAII